MLATWRCVCPIKSASKSPVRIPVSIPSTTEGATSEDHRIAWMAALAIALSMAEAVFPSPIPGVKPGLANIVILLVLYQDGLRAAIWVSALRVVAGSLFFGSFLTPTFFLSLSGAACSLFMLLITSHLPRNSFGPVTHSLLSSLAHIAGQLVVVYLWLIPHRGIIYLIPVLAISAVIFGLVNGIIAARLLNSSLSAPLPQPAPHAAP
jgi:heptaprenyl diphosphate synthase